MALMTINLNLSNSVIQLSVPTHQNISGMIFHNCSMIILRAYVKCFFMGRRRKGSGANNVL